MLLAFFAGALLTQAQPVPNIVVTAPRQQDSAAVRSYVRDTALVLDGQIARFRDPVCPAVFGLPTDYATRVIRRVRAVARAAGLAEAAEGCTPNVSLLFANNSLRAAQELQRQRPGLFAGLSSFEQRRLLSTRAMPVRAWSTSETRNEDGGEFQVRSTDTRRDTGQAGDNVVRVRSSSIINMSTEPVLTQSIVIMEEQATVGKTLDQLADYAAVRALTGSRPGDGAATRGNSILGLFDAQAEAPRSITALDLAYLRALRQVRGNQRSTAQAARIAQFIDAELARSR